MKIVEALENKTLLIIAGRAEIGKSYLKIILASRIQNKFIYKDLTIVVLKHYQHKEKGRKCLDVDYINEQIKNCKIK